MKIILLTLFTAVFLSACSLGRTFLFPRAKEATPDSPATQSGQLDQPQWQGQGDFAFDKLEHDFGTVKQSDGVVTTTFRLKYTGSEPIEVTGLPTSCACTSAQLSQQRFESGDTAELTVRFNANLHPEPKEKFFRTVSFITKPPQASPAEIKIWVTHIEDLGPEAYEIPVHAE